MTHLFFVYRDTLKIKIKSCFAFKQMKAGNLYLGVQMVLFLPPVDNNTRSSLEAFFRETPGIHSPTYWMNQSASLSDSFKERLILRRQDYNPFLEFVPQPFSSLCHVHTDSEEDSISICFDSNTSGQNVFACMCVRVCSQISCSILTLPASSLALHNVEW